MTVASTKSGIEPAIGTPSNPSTTKIRDSVAATTMTNPFAQILASMISIGVTGMTSRCSMVPCSRSRMRAAPVRMTESMVTLLITCITAMNQPDLRLGLKATRTTTSTGAATAAAGNIASTSRWTISCR